MPQRLQYDFTFSNSQKDPSANQRSNGAMCILLMGDFSGRSNRGLHESGDKLAKRSIAAVDFDNFNETMARFAPQLRLPIGDTTESGMAIQFAQLKDFHPDELYQNLGLFQALRELRARLMDSTTLPQAAAELRNDALKPTQLAEPSASDTEPDLQEDESLMFERLLGRQLSEKMSTSSSKAESHTAIHPFIQSIVKPYIIPETDPLQAQYVAAVDETISEQMRAVLHHADFQALEALWRSAYGLVTGLETGEELKLYLLDITKDELAEDIRATQGQLEQSALYRLLVEDGKGAPGGEPWSVLVGDYSFSTEAQNLSLLAALGAIASQAGGPFLAAADASMLGCRSLPETPDPRDWKLKDKQAEQAWQTLRQSSVAEWIGLAQPRILLRLPYGKTSDPLEYFDFEELRPQHAHEAYLWGNPAFACALLIAMAFQTKGWSMQPGDYLEVEDLPAFTFEEEGEAKMMACAELFLIERAAEAMLDSGVMPMISYRNRNAIRLMRFQSIAEPLKALSGSWV
jgi:type VI secretion system protein ImpC